MTNQRGNKETRINVLVFTYLLYNLYEQHFAGICFNTRICCDMRDMGLLTRFWWVRWVACRVKRELKKDVLLNILHWWLKYYRLPWLFMQNVRELL
jgi:hypothetical protein